MTQSPTKLFKLANPNCLLYPVLTFSWKLHKAFCLSFLLTPVFCYLIKTWHFPCDSAWHAVIPSLGPRNRINLFSSVPSVSPLVATPNCPSTKRTQNTCYLQARKEGAALFSKWVILSCAFSAVIRSSSQSGTCSIMSLRALVIKARLQISGVVLAHRTFHCLLTAISASCCPAPISH